MQHRLMYQGDIDYLYRRERVKELIREVEHERLIEAVRAKQPAKSRKILKQLAQLLLAPVQGDVQG